MNQSFDSIADWLFTDIRQLPFFGARRQVEASTNVPKTMLSSIVAAATHAGPKRINEDAVTVGSSWCHNLVTIADGVGGREKGKEAAETAVRVFNGSIKTKIRQSGTIHCEDIKPIYEQAARAIREKKYGKTTLISIIEKPRYFIISYLGDGQAYFLRGDTEAGVPLVIGHRKNGLLGGTIGEILTAEPVVMQVSKAFISGEIVIAGTDGIFSDEIRSKKPELLSELLTTIKNASEDTNFTQVLYDFLDDLNKDNLLEDNATLGIIITRRAVDSMLKARCSCELR